MKPALLVLAAGMGSRFGGLKQIEPVGPSGETVIDYSVFDALRAGFGKIVFLIRRDFEADFRERVGKRWESRADVVYAHQSVDQLPGGFKPPAGREKPWGTGHALWCARNAISTPFAAINADDFYGADAYAKIAGFLAEKHPSPPRFCMVGYRLGQTLSGHGAVTRGVCRLNADGFLEGVEEVTGLERDGDGASARRLDGSARHFPGSKIVSMNCWGFQPAVFEEIGHSLLSFLKAYGGNATAEFYLPAAIADLVSKGGANVRVLETGARWLGVTYRDDKAGVVESIAALTVAGDYPSPLAGP